MQADVGKYLDRHPDVSFDLSAHIEATQYKDRLLARFRAFTECCGHFSDISAEDFQSIYAGLRTHVEGYQAYPDAATLPDLELMTKSVLRAGSEKFLDRRCIDGTVWVKNTSGTTGPPVSIYRSPEFSFNVTYLTVPRILWLAGYRHLQHAVLSLSALDVLKPAAFLHAPLDDFGLMLRIPVDGADIESLMQVFRFSRELNPFCLVSTPTVMEQLLDYDIADSENGMPSIVISSGSRLLDDLRKQFEDKFSCRVINAYCSSEFGVVASECEMHQQMHIHSGMLAVEIVNERGEVLGENEVGELVISSVDNQAFPLLRFRTGDIAAITSAPCQCGLPGRRLTHLHGRIVQSFKLPSGKLISPSLFYKLPVEFNLREYQIIQCADGEFDVRIDPMSGDNADALCQHVSEYLARVIKEDVIIGTSLASIQEQTNYQRFQVRH